jgi:8-oxo-dGTP pyrophosphatase MutT (NUDIX family)
MCVYSDWSPKKSYRQTGTRSKYKAGVVLINPANEVLLVQNCGGKWSFPKGNVEPSEDAKSAAVRELMEETGICIDKECLKLTARYYKHVYFICAAARGKTFDMENIADKNEITGIGWFCMDYNFSNKIKITRPTERVLRALRADLENSTVE